MTRALRWYGWWLAALGLAGCAGQVHTPPPAGAPYALAKLRIVHHGGAPGDLTDTVWLGEAQVPLREHGVGAPLSSAQRIAPGPAHWTVRAVFSHVEPWKRRDQATFPVGPCGTDSRGRPILCSRPAPTPMHPPDDPEVIDAVCEARLKHVAEAGRIYLLRFDFYAGDYCTARCLLQTFEAPGQFRFEACPLPTAAP
jgi:hypothetical protein